MAPLVLQSTSNFEENTLFAIFGSLLITIGTMITFFVVWLLCCCGGSKKKGSPKADDATVEKKTTVEEKQMAMSMIVGKTGKATEANQSLMQSARDGSTTTTTDASDKSFRTALVYQIEPYKRLKPKLPPSDASTFGSSSKKENKAERNRSSQSKSSIKKSASKSSKNKSPIAKRSKSKSKYRQQKEQKKSINAKQIMKETGTQTESIKNKSMSIRDAPKEKSMLDASLKEKSAIGPNTKPPAAVMKMRQPEKSKPQASIRPESSLTCRATSTMVIQIVAVITLASLFTPATGLFKANVADIGSSVFYYKDYPKLNHSSYTPRLFPAIVDRSNQAVNGLAISMETKLSNYQNRLFMQNETNASAASQNGRTRGRGTFLCQIISGKTDQGIIYSHDETNAKLCSKSVSLGESK